MQNAQAVIKGYVSFVRFTLAKAVAGVLYLSFESASNLVEYNDVTVFPL
jgi:hypothetical protein